MARPEQDGIITSMEICEIKKKKCRPPKITCMMLHVNWRTWPNLVNFADLKSLFSTDSHILKKKTAPLKMHKQIYKNYI